MKMLLTMTLLGLTAPASASPIIYDFRLPEYDPQGAQSITVVRPDAPRIAVTGDGPNTNLYWDTQDGIGITGPSYADDEVEGAREVLRVTFDHHVRIIEIGLSDFFYENEAYPGAPPCYLPNWPTCYQERGQYSYDGGATWLDMIAPMSNLRLVTNGEYAFGTFLWTNELLFRAPGAVTLPGFPYTQLHDFSLMTLTLKPMEAPAVPEPATLSLLGVGLLGVRWWRRSAAGRDEA